MHEKKVYMIALMVYLLISNTLLETQSFFFNATMELITMNIDM